MKMNKILSIIACSLFAVNGFGQTMMFSETMSSDLEGWYSGNASEIAVAAVVNNTIDEVNPSSQVVKIERKTTGSSYIWFRDKSWSLSSGSGTDQYKYLHFDIRTTADCGNIRFTFEDTSNTMRGYKDQTLAQLGATADGKWHHVVLYMGDSKDFQNNALNHNCWRFGFRPTNVGSIYLDNVYVSKDDVSVEPLSVNEVGMSSYVTINPLDFTDSSLECYVATAEGSDAITVAQVNKVKAGEPVIIMGDENASELVPVLSGAADDYTNLLSGSLTQTHTVTAGETIYALGQDALFHPVSAEVVIPAMKAYLVSTGGAQAKRLVFGETTGIKNENQNQNENAVYNLQGQRVSAAHKGIVIKNGKKYFNK